MMDQVTQLIEIRDAALQRLQNNPDFKLVNSLDSLIRDLQASTDTNSTEIEATVSDNGGADDQSTLVTKPADHDTPSQEAILSEPMPVTGANKQAREPENADGNEQPEVDQITASQETDEAQDLSDFPASGVNEDLIAFANNPEPMVSKTDEGDESEHFTPFTSFDEKPAPTEIEKRSSALDDLESDLARAVEEPLVKSPFLTSPQDGSVN